MIITWHEFQDRINTYYEVIQKQPGLHVFMWLWDCLLQESAPGQRNIKNRT